MHNETMGFELSVEPFDSSLVSGHANLSKNVLTCACEISSVKDNLVVFKAEFELFSAILALILSQIRPVEMVHAIVHAVFGG